MTCCGTFWVRQTRNFPVGENWPRFNAPPFPPTERIHGAGVELEERFAAGADDVTPHHERARPLRRDRIGKLVGISKTSAAGAVRSDEIRVAKCADGVRTILFAARPQVASRKPAKHRRPAGVGAFALQSVEDLFDAVRHAVFAAL